MIVAERSFAERHGLEPLARLVSHGIAGVKPGMFGIDPVPAVRLALARANWKVSDVERLEIRGALTGDPRLSSFVWTARDPSASLGPTGRSAAQARSLV